MNKAQLTDRSIQSAKKLGHTAAVSLDVFEVVRAACTLDDKQTTEVNSRLASIPAIGMPKNASKVELTPDAIRAIDIAKDRELTFEVLQDILEVVEHEASPTSESSSGSTQAQAVQEVAPVEVEPSAAPTEVVPAKQLKTLDECLAELDELVGLDDVKKQIRGVVATHQVNLEREKAGLPTVNAGNHLVFTGEPGTGKTTVARIVSEIYKSLGILSKGHLVEAGKADLVGEYVGQTAPKVKKKVQEALNGTLFIDEAYALNEGVLGGYGDEAIATLLQEIENHRDKLAVILAGYTDEMNHFINRNPGMRSRFGAVVEFGSYSKPALLEIFNRMSASHGIEVPEDVIEKLKQHFANNETHGSAGNARYVRKLFETMNANMSKRAVADGVIERDEITVFRAEDVPETLSGSAQKRTRVGF